MEVVVQPCLLVTLDQHVARVVGVGVHHQRRESKTYRLAPNAFIITLDARKCGRPR